MGRSTPFPPSVDPAIPKLSQCPVGWSRSTFGDLLEIVERPVVLEPRKKYRLVNARRNRGGVVLRCELTGAEILTKTQFEIRANDFLISRRQIIHGACGVVPSSLEGAIVSNEYSSLRTRPNLDIEFLRYLCHTPYFQQTCFHSSHGVDIEKMVFKIERWLSWPVYVPPLPEQRKIAAILSSIDDTIEATQAVIDQLQVVKKAMMEELLTRGIPGQHREFRRAEIGRLPAGWEVGPLGKFCSVTSGGTPSRAHPEFWNGNIAWVKTSEINYSVISGTEETVTELGLENSSAKILPRGTLLVAMYGQGSTRGRVAILGIEAAINQACLGIRQGSRLRNRFLFHYFAMQYGILREVGNEGTQKNLNAALIKSFLVPVPDIEEQNEICSILDSMEDRIRKEAAVLAATQELKLALLSTLLTGEIRVKVDEDSSTPEAIL